MKFLSSLIALCVLALTASACNYGNGVTRQRFFTQQGTFYGQGAALAPGGGCSYGGASIQQSFAPSVGYGVQQSFAPAVGYTYSQQQFFSPGFATYSPGFNLNIGRGFGVRRGFIGTGFAPGFNLNIGRRGFFRNRGFFNLQIR